MINILNTLDSKALLHELSSQRESFLDAKRILVIAGPTASGKSSLALDIAQRIDGSIINADSMQLYEHLPCLTAMPTDADFAASPHYLYKMITDPNAIKSVAWWRERCVQAIDAEIAKGRIPIIVGGTGLYVSALINGLNPIPDIDPNIREDLRTQSASSENRNDLYALLEEEDPDSARNLKPKDTQRILRALEVIRSTGHSLLYWQQQPQEGIKNPMTSILCDGPREHIVKRAELRVAAMLDGSAIPEVERVLNQGLETSSPLYKAVGVREIKAFLDGELSLDQAQEKMSIATRQYIKRQQTWFNNQMTFDYKVEV